MRLLKFTLAAPLQSWGEDARWDYRSTGHMPTKSALIGMMGCCLGYPRGDQRLNFLDANLRCAVRADRPGRVMTDYHTVQGTGGMLLNSEGKKRAGGATIITKKQYLQDARFTVFLWGEEETLNACYGAMTHPKWTLYLGRKGAVPSVPVIPEWVEASTPEEAVTRFTEEERKRSLKVVQVEMDAQYQEPLSNGQRLLSRRDAVLRSDRNEYAVRWVRAFTVSTEEGRICT